MTILSTYVVDKLKSILYQEYWLRNQHKYGGQTSVEYWRDCDRAISEPYRKKLEALGRGESVRELEDGYVEGVRAEVKREGARRSKLEEEVEERKIRSHIEPEKPRLEGGSRGGLRKVWNLITKKKKQPLY
ncbi:MAG: hypothetical protein NUV37_01170 [Nanoarchaeota archaeon]|nr:hypothetical protein [Nanoarchaeota archaeon]